MTLIHMYKYVTLYTFEFYQYIYIIISDKLQ